MTNRLLTTVATLFLLATALVATAPAATAQPAAPTAAETTSEITFYGHIFGHGRGAPMPMNTQFPYGEQDYSIGSTAHSCGVDIPEVQSNCEDDAANEVWLYTTAGFVQIKERSDFAYDKLHNERGLTKDTYLDTSKDITATFYMSADMHGWLIALSEPGTPSDLPWPVWGWNWDPGYLAQWQVEATLYAGILGEHGGAAAEAPDIAAALADGKLTPLAQGVSDPQDVQSLEVAGQPTVWKFDINLGAPAKNVITKEESYVVRFQFHGVKPDGSRSVIPEAETWNINSGEFYPVMITLPVKGAFNVEMVLPQFVYDKLVILGIMNTPWGSYDVDHDSIKLEIKDSSGTRFEPRSISRLADFSVAHEGHYKPVNITYVWDYKADGLKPGVYTATVSASNFQGSASASCAATFEVLEGGAAGPITVGECGVRTITDDQLGAITEGSKQDAQGTGRAAPLPIPQVGLATASVAPVGGSAATLVPLAALAAIAFVIVTRRCRQ